MGITVVPGLIGMAISAYTDIKYGKILNKVVIPLIIFSLIAIAIVDIELLGTSAKAGLITWGIFLIPVMLNLLGGGDAKLLALAGIIFRENTAYVVIYLGILMVLWVLVYDILKTKSVGKTLAHLLLFKKTSTSHVRHKSGALLIFIASLVCYIKFI